ncbi:DUF3324 domain-containing protein [Companilactobacillus ginsenosidimutans]|uniref:Uncharacterized protein n=1 Tax=Companilactobacillus ginsenosidimutans TaxID=1007676 RepID=A0A0H4QI04_9LACO|nr:DUF3324 domain-containing protein [Companilactobacillus ginsenosidimutans]AKP68054.1 hypothetical protein ABM34_11250 [Companilactobacillus ginsenosidimutans]
MTRLFRKIFLGLALIFSIVGAMNFTEIAQAGTSGDYTLKPATDNGSKVNIDGGFYLIKGNPGETVDVKVDVFNTSDTERQFIVSINTAYTSDDGQPAYDSSKVSDPNLKIQMHNLVQNNGQIVAVAGNKSTQAILKVKIPDQHYTGFLMGGLNVQPYHEKAKGTVTENGTLIKNKFSYSLPIQMAQLGSQNDDVNYKINRVVPKIVNTSVGKEVGVAANVANTKNAFLPDLSSKAVITKYGDSKFKMTEKKDGQSMAPTSNYNYTVSWGKTPLRAGKYHIKMTYSGSSVRTWVLDKDFVITDAQAAKYNNLAGHKPNYLWLYILLGVLLLALILGLGIFLGKKNSKGTENNSMNRRSRRRR